MKKKAFSTITAILLVGVMMLAACSGGNGGNGTSTAAGSEASSDAGSSNETVAVTGEYTLNMCYSNSDETTMGQIAIEFKRLTEEMTDGRIAVNLYPNGTMSSTMDEINTVLNGVAEACYTVNPVADTVVPLENVITIPFLVTVDAGDYRLEQAIDSDPEIQALIDAQAEANGLHRLGNFPTNLGAFSIANNKLPVNTLSDANGLKIRSAGGEMYNIMLNGFGASNIPISVTELAVALQQGTVDGLTTCLTFYHPSSMHTKYLTMPWIMDASEPIYINKTWWDSLPADLQDIMDNQVAPATLQYACELLSEVESEYLELIQQDPYNVEVTYLDLDSPEMQEFAESARQQGLQYYLDKCGDDAQKIYDRIIEIKKELGYDE